MAGSTCKGSGTEATNERPPNPHPAGNSPHPRNHQDKVGMQSLHWSARKNRFLTVAFLSPSCTSSSFLCTSVPKPETYFSLSSSFPLPYSFPLLFSFSLIAFPSFSCSDLVSSWLLTLAFSLRFPVTLLLFFLFHFTITIFFSSWLTLVVSLLLSPLWLCSPQRVGVPQSLFEDTWRELLPGT